MDDELARVAHEGVIYDGPEDSLPYASIDEADMAVTEGLTLVRDGDISAKRGVELLEEARRRGAWKLLDYDSWDACLEDRADHVYRAVMDKEVRLALVARLRASGTSTRGIAAITGTSPATASRDVVDVRRSGLLDEEPDQVRGADGKLRSTRVPEPRETTGKKASSTIGLPRAFDNFVDVLESKTLTMVSLPTRDPEAWARNRETLAKRRHDLRRIGERISQLLDDLED